MSDTQQVEAPAEAPTEQVEAPTQQAEAPTEQAEAPTQQVEAPTQQVEAPTQQVEAPAEAPTQQAEAPTQQVEAPTQQVEVVQEESQQEAQPECQETQELDDTDFKDEGIDDIIDDVGLDDVPSPVEEEAEEDSVGVKYTDVLQKTQGTLIDCVQPTRKLLDYLAQQAVLNPGMVNQIMCRPSRSERAKLLVELLQVLGPQSFLTFVDALKHTGQDHVAKVLGAHDIVA